MNTSGTDYLFPIMYEDGCQKKYSSSIRIHNKKLKTISSIAHLDIPLPSYVSRHSWASIAKADGIPILTISEGMGHTSEKTTQIYLSTLSQKTLDEANRLVINSIK
jgi:integrase